MCGINIFNFVINNLDYINYYLKHRGPDCCNHLVYKDIFFNHNLLHITGKISTQPFIDILNEIVCIYNGEIYNYKDFGEYDSDGKCLIDLYKKYGKTFIEYLDGEFAIALFDFKKNIFIISTDIFSTKPLWYSINSTTNKMGISSYESCLNRAGLEDCIKLKANTTQIYNLNTLKLLETRQVYQFKLNQFKTTYDDWCSAFLESIKKRVANDNYPVFVCLSSGYDSGAICAALNIIGKEYYTYTIVAIENIDIINKRLELNKKFCLGNNVVNFTENEFNMIKKDIILESERFIYKTHDLSGKDVVTDDDASVGLSKICRLASEDKIRIYLSGQGADEIMSDYSKNGQPIYHHSCFSGKYPDNLNDILSNDPYCDMIWKSFYSGIQEDYIGKEEVISGRHGIEGRYPYLDKNLVQEFLSLTPELKKNAYKAPLDFFFKKYNYPYDVGIKIGFHAGHNLQK
jgi:asparagine synthase (glutamine-hydrolysing)